MNDATLTLEIAGGVRIVVPANLADLSTFVFLEQEDWFEDEAAFVRRLARPGFTMLDIGANHGFYTLAAAAAAGGAAEIRAFEPTPDVAASLARSVALNGFAGIHVEPVALGDRDGHIAFARHAFSAINRIGTGADAVPIARLDTVVAGAGIGDIDFVKLDVEGAELQVLAGGEAFFAQRSPLVMFEIRDASGVNLAVAERMRGLGYEIYELVLEPPMLVPARPPFDEYRLNLFACRPARAEALERAGLLARSESPAAPAPREAILSMVMRNAAFAPARAAIERLVAGLDPAEPLARALGLLALARDAGAAPSMRAGALRGAMAAAEAAVAARPGLPAFATAARIARMAGRRQLGVEWARRLVESVLRGAEVKLDAPFVAMLPEYETWCSPLGAGAWVSAMAVESLWRWTSFSSIFSEPPFPQHPADLLRGFGRELPEFERRRQLKNMDRGAQKGPIAHPLLVERSPANLNPAFWTGPGFSGGG